MHQIYYLYFCTNSCKMSILLILFVLLKLGRRPPFKEGKAAFFSDRWLTFFM